MFLELEKMSMMIRVVSPKGRRELSKCFEDIRKDRGDFLDHVNTLRKFGADDKKIALISLAANSVKLIDALEHDSAKKMETKLTKLQ